MSDRNNNPSNNPAVPAPDLKLIVAKVQDAAGNWGVQFTFNLGMVGAGIQLDPTSARALGQNLIKAAEAAASSLVTPAGKVSLS